MNEQFREKITSYKEAVVGNGIYDVVKKLVGILLGGTLTPTATNIAIDLLNIDIINKYKIPITIVLTLIIILIILEIYDRNFKHRPTTPDVKGNYDVLKKEVTFTYGRECSKYEMNLLVKSNIKGLNRISGKYTWSGSGQAEISCANKHCKIIPLTRKDSFIEYEVELRKNYRKGVKVECAVIGKMPDPQHTFIPFFSSQITQETKHLIINICIPPEYGVREIICEEIAIVRNSNEKSEVILLNEDGKYNWVIPRPKLFYKYSVRWEL